MKDGQTDFTTDLSQNADKLLNSGPEELNAVLKIHDLTPEALDDMVRSIREWLKKQPHLPEDKLRDRQIIGHLIFRYFSVEKVKQNLDIYFSARHRMPELVCNRDPLDPKISEYLKRAHWIIMPKKTPEGYRVSFMRFTPTENLQVALIVKIVMMTVEYRFWNETSLGEVCVIDMDKISLQDTMQVTPVLLSHIVYYAMGCLGARLKSFRIINLPSFAATLVNIFKKFMKPKLADRVVVCTKEEVEKSLPKECLPLEYGGVGGSFQEIADEWCKTLQSDAWRQFFLEQNDVFSDESKRLVPNNAGDFFGADGSFRKLALD